MESQSFVNVLFLTLEWMLLLSVLGYFFIRKPLSTIVGTFDWKQTLHAGIIIFSQLLLVAIILDTGTQYLGINDTQLVEGAAQNIFAQGFFGAGKMVISATAEEVFFRGILFTLLGSIPSIILFGAAHAGYFSWVELIGALAAGFILIRAREKNKSIFPGVFGHALYNLVIVFILLRG